MELDKTVNHILEKAAWSIIRGSVELSVIKSIDNQTYFSVCDSIWIPLYQIVGNGLHDSIELCVDDKVELKWKSAIQ